MNIGKDNKHPDYICDKCGNRIRYVFDKVPKGFVGLNKYYKQLPSCPAKRDFDLCGSCEKKFREWLNTREIPTTEEIINMFPQYQESKVKSLHASEELKRAIKPVFNLIYEDDSEGEDI